MAPNLPAGLYEVLVTESLLEAIEHVDADVVAERRLEGYEAPDRIALYLATLIRLSLESLPESDRVRTGVALARTTSEQLSEMLSVDHTDELVEPGRVLTAVLRRRPDGSTQPIRQPLVPLLDTTLLTECPRRTEPMEPTHSGGAIGGFHRPDHGLHQAEWNCPSVGSVSSPLCRRSFTSSADDDLYRLDGTVCIGRTGGARCRDSDFVRPDRDSTSCEGLALPKTFGVFNSFHWFVESDVLSTSHWDGVEYSRILRRAIPMCWQSVPRYLRPTGKVTTSLPIPRRNSERSKVDPSGRTMVP